MINGGHDAEGEGAEETGFEVVEGGDAIVEDPICNVLARLGIIKEVPI